jgi:excisionase family DNA binding protein
MVRPIDQNPANWCTRKEAAATFRVSTDTIDRWIKAGQLRAKKDPGGKGVMILVLDFPPGVWRNQRGTEATG